MKELPLPKCIATEKYNMYLHLPLENQSILLFSTSQVLDGSDPVTSHLYHTVCSMIQLGNIGSDWFVSQLGLGSMR
jgi:hypothetical protein